MGLHNIKNRDHLSLTRMLTFVGVPTLAPRVSPVTSCLCGVNSIIWQKLCPVIGILHGVVLWKTLIGTKVILTRVDYKTLSAIQTNHPCGILGQCRLMVMILIFLLIKLST